MDEASVLARRRTLGAFLRAQRERLEPAAVGLPAGARRRTPGLRREEVAQLCGLSTTWYTWIEQGRDVSVSPAALASLVTTLHLGRGERAYLFDLAGKRDPQPDAVETTMPASLPACVAAIAAPAYVLGVAWNALAWNPPAEQLFVGWLDRPGTPNLLRFIFLEPGAPNLIHGWEQRARRALAEFRADCGAHLEEPPVRALLAELRQRSDAFARLWQEHSVTGREGGERSFAHPLLGFRRYQQTSFEVAGRPDLKLAILVPLDGVPGPTPARGDEIVSSLRPA
jgi:transcriptional regulator with XRE-family HTH domain